MEKIKPVTWIVTYLIVKDFVEVERTEEVTPTFRQRRYTEEQAKQHLQYHSKDKLILGVKIKK